MFVRGTLWALPVFVLFVRISAASLYAHRQCQLHAQVLLRVDQPCIGSKWSLMSLPTKLRETETNYST